MAEIIASKLTNMAICNALGIDPAATGAVTIYLVPGKFPTVTVERLITRDQAEALADHLNEFMLVPKEDR
jgi:hypothetical protein